MNNFIFENATKVYFERGCVREYLRCKMNPYSTVMLAYGGGSIKANGIYGEVMEILRSGSSPSGLLPAYLSGMFSWKERIELRKKAAALVMGLMMTAGLAACGNGTAQTSQTEEAKEETAGGEESSASETAAAESEEGTSAEDSGSNVLIAYFTMPEDVDTTGVDAIAGASIVVNGDAVMGNVEYMAHVIRETVGGDLFRIETVQQYPLVDQAAADFPGPKKPCLRQRRSFYLSWNFRFQIPFPFPE